MLLSTCFSGLWTLGCCTVHQKLQHFNCFTKSTPRSKIGCDDAGFNELPNRYGFVSKHCCSLVKHYNSCNGLVIITEKYNTQIIYNRVGISICIYACKHNRHSMTYRYPIIIIDQDHRSSPLALAYYLDCVRLQGPGLPCLALASSSYRFMQAGSWCSSVIGVRPTMSKIS